MKVKFKNYEELKPLLTLVPMRRERVEKGTLHKDVIDISICYGAKIKNRIEFLNEECLKACEVQEEQIYKDALENDMKNEPAILRRTEDMIEDLAKEVGVGFNRGDIEDETLYTAHTGLPFGAKVIMYPGFFGKVRDALEEDYYFTLSSVHELMITRASAVKNAEYLKRLKDCIKSANEENLQKDILSYSVYHWSQEKQQLTVIGD